MARLGLLVSSLPDRMSHGPYQKKYLVSPADMERLVEQYKGTVVIEATLGPNQSERSKFCLDQSEARI